MSRNPDGIYQLGQTSFGPFYHGRWELGNFSLDLDAHVLAMPLAALPYAVDEVNRIYNYGPGATGRVVAELKHPDGATSSQTFVSIGSMLSMA